jgi:hypothetical protein
MRKKIEMALETSRQSCAKQRAGERLFNQPP